ncbi:hypothetical protein CB1_000331039 [Camelus ferus]|nr:hypothetical protein CB1_000331039 [Camelus ferus]
MPGVRARRAHRPRDQVAALVPKEGLAKPPAAAKSSPSLGSSSPSSSSVGGSGAPSDQQALLRRGRRHLQGVGFNSFDFRGSRPTTETEFIAWGPTGEEEALESNTFPGIYGPTTVSTFQTRKTTVATATTTATATTATSMTLQTKGVTEPLDPRSRILVGVSTTEPSASPSKDSDKDSKPPRVLGETSVLELSMDKSGTPSWAPRGARRWLVRSGSAAAAQGGACTPTPVGPGVGREPRASVRTSVKRGDLCQASPGSQVTHARAPGELESARPCLLSELLPVLAPVRGGGSADPLVGTARYCREAGRALWAPGGSGWSHRAYGEGLEGRAKERAGGAAAAAGLCPAPRPSLWDSGVLKCGLCPDTPHGGCSAVPGPTDGCPGPGLAVHQIITITVSLIMVIAALITTLVLKNCCAQSGNTRRNGHQRKATQQEESCQNLTDFTPARVPSSLDIFTAYNETLQCSHECVRASVPVYTDETLHPTGEYKSTFNGNRRWTRSSTREHTPSGDLAPRRHPSRTGGPDPHAATLAWQGRGRVRLGTPDATCLASYERFHQEVREPTGFEFGRNGAAKSPAFEAVVLQACRVSGSEVIDAKAGGGGEKLREKPRGGAGRVALRRCSWPRSDPSREVPELSVVLKTLRALLGKNQRVDVLLIVLDNHPERVTEDTSTQTRTS